MSDKTYEFDASISVMADGSTRQEVADFILDIANSNDIAISLQKEDTLNVGLLKKQIEFLKGELNQLATFNPDWDMLQASRESLREHMAELSKARAALNTCNQFVLEVAHAQRSGPGWYTQGEDGLRKHIYMWIGRASDAIKEALNEQQTET